MRLVYKTQGLESEIARILIEKGRPDLLAYFMNSEAVGEAVNSLDRVSDLLWEYSNELDGPIGHLLMADSIEIVGSSDDGENITITFEPHPDPLGE